MSDVPERKVIEIGPRFRLRSFNSITIGSEHVYLIKGIVPRFGLVVVWGPWGSGKSFWTFDLVMHIALGWEYRGRRVQQGSVVYLALEGGKGFEARIEAFRERFLPEDPDEVPFFLIADTLNLVRDHSDLIGCIRLQAKSSPAVVVIDTLNRSLVGSESDDKDMAAYIRAADAIRDAFNCVVIIVHHCGIDTTRPRGHTSLMGAADVGLAAKRDPTKNIVITVEKMKDGPEGGELFSELEIVEVGTDQEGAHITSCVVVPIDRAPVKHAGKQLSATQELAKRSLAESLCESGFAPPAGFPTSVACVVDLETWRTRCERDGFCAEVKDRDNRSRSFRRVRQDLQKKNVIGIRDELVWLAVQAGRGDDEI